MGTERDPLLGTVFAGRYRIERRLGSGGMGCVYVATQLSMSREVALKVLNPDLSDSESAVQRFVREMKASSKIEHPNTIRIYDFGRSDEGRLFLAMELLRGKTLHQALRETGALDTARLLRIAEQIARALGAAHAEGIIHRDLKPENIMLIDKYGEKDQVCVLDFGIARFAEGGVEHGEPSLTRTGSLIGTPLYMSPEQAMGRPVDQRSDLYALGVLLYQMATGSVPFTAETPIRVLFMHANDTPKLPSELVKGRVPMRLEALILSLLAKSADDRPPNAAAVITALRGVTQSQTVVEADGLLRPISRLRSTDAMARARAAFHDPASQVPTAHSVTVDPDADPLMQTAAALDGGPVAELHAADDLVGGMTVDGEQVALETADTGEVASLVHDAPTLAPAPSAAAVGATPSPADAVSLQAPEPAETNGDRAEWHAADMVLVSRGGSAKWLVGLLALAALAFAVFWLARPDHAPRARVASANHMSGRVSDDSPTASQQTPSASAADSAAARAALVAARAAAGDPPTPESCRITDTVTIRLLTAAVQQLAGGRPRGKRPQDTAAAARLAAIKPPQSTAPEVQATLARAQLLAGQSDPAIIGLAKAARTACPTLALAWEVEGTVHLLSMRAPIATQLLTKAVANASGFQRARYNLGLAQLSSDHPGAALASFQEVRRREPQRPGVMTGVGQAYLSAKDFPRAVAALSEATLRAPGSGATWYLLGMAHKLAGDPGEAQRAWCTAAKLGHPRAGRKCPDAAGMPAPK